MRSYVVISIFITVFTIVFPFLTKEPPLLANSETEMFNRKSEEEVIKTDSLEKEISLGLKEVKTKQKINKDLIYSLYVKNEKLIEINYFLQKQNDSLKNIINTTALTYGY